MKKESDAFEFHGHRSQLQPWHENLGKRQVKSPKIYFRDTGLLHTLMGVKTLPELVTHPRAGASWEGFALEQVLRIARPEQAYFWATHQGAELDALYVVHPGLHRFRLADGIEAVPLWAMLPDAAVPQ